MMGLEASESIDGAHPVMLGKEGDTRYIQVDKTEYSTKAIELQLCTGASANNETK